MNGEPWGYVGANESRFAASYIAGVFLATIFGVVSAHRSSIGWNSPSPARPLGTQLPAVPIGHMQKVKQ